MKILFLILMPIVMSCSPTYCKEVDRTPLKTLEIGKPRMANDWHEEETDPQPIIDWPFNVS